jgi:hypothetical protein
MKQAAASGTGEIRAVIDSRYFRPTEIDLLIGDPAKGREKLWSTHEVSVRDFARELVTDDLQIMADTPIGQGNCYVRCARWARPPGQHQSSWAGGQHPLPLSRSKQGVTASILLGRCRSSVIGTKP